MTVEREAKFTLQVGYICRGKVSESECCKREAWVET